MMRPLKKIKIYFKYFFGFNEYIPFREGGEIVSPPSGYIKMRSNYPSSIFFKHKRRNEYYGNSFEICKGVLKRTHRRFTYKKEITDNWQSHFDNLPFVGDCDDFALTCAEILYFAGIPVKIVFCKTETEELHLACIADNKYLLDNRFKIIMPWQEVEYKWFSYMDLDKPRIWRSCLK